MGSEPDFSRIEEVRDRKVQALENAIHGLKAQATFLIQEIGDVRLTEPGFVGERRARNLMVADFIGY